MNKQKIREKLKKIRDNLSEDRKKAASKELFHKLVDHLASFNHVLSFSSFQSEIDTLLLNHFLAITGRLYLPKMESSGSLELYQVTNIKTLKKGPLGIYEPDAAFCQKVCAQIIEVILVPALGFDKKNYRIGYGKGSYDRFLAQMPQCRTIGVGFKEQLTKSLPIDATDVSLSEVNLF